MKRHENEQPGAWKPYVSCFPNVGLLRASGDSMMFGCIECGETWWVAGAACFFDRALEAFNRHLHLPEEADIEPLDPSGVPRIWSIQ